MSADMTCRYPAVRTRRRPDAAVAFAAVRRLHRRPHPQPGAFPRAGDSDHHRPPEPVDRRRPAQAVREQRQIVVALQRDPEKNDVGPGDLHPMGVVANILRYITASETEHHIVCQGVQRFRIGEYLPGWPFPVARGLHMPEPSDGGTEVEARFLYLKQQALVILDLVPQVPPGLRARWWRRSPAPEDAGRTSAPAAYLDITPGGKAADPRRPST